MRIISVIAALALVLTQQACAREPSHASAPEPVAAVAVSEVASSSATAPKPLAQCTANPAATIDSAIAATLAAVKNNKPADLLAQLAPDGVDINGKVLKAALSREFTARSGHYCDLFACSGKDGPLHRLFKDGKIDKQVDVKNGRASVFVNANSNDELDLSYKWSGCKWWLTAIATP